MMDDQFARTRAVWFQMIEAAMDEIPLLMLWAMGDWKAEGKEEPFCDAPHFTFHNEDEPLCDERVCTDDPTWVVALPTPDGAGSVALCGKHLALLILRRDGNVTEPLP